jgi:hypothetical protein
VATDPFEPKDSEMPDEEIEAHRQHKMTTLAEAREQYRRWAARTSRRLGALSEDQRSLQMAVRVAYADLRLFNQKHPQLGSPRSVPTRCGREVAERPFRRPSPLTRPRPGRR